ncbi:SGNH/GDSL hydrolase family protein [Aliiruegeria sabulilitoris]|uniref:SGNH/GDSL hydrolase family protein n=1 Tax=Aliiruegeria sabulilitoris TaxID=1510458 RepID=UPI00082E03CD|nr:SGNH/GDSL hydrolase family protein [Aliiruegeria sabulilitoris]NDR55414.1 lipolytic enzyme, G-D-S-L [Pseudoruegeria sp. M32A2M]
MPQTLLCFGDSNTHGTLPITSSTVRARYNASTRWPGVALAHLGPDWDLVEEGLPGRTAQFEDPVMGAFMDGRPGLRIALQSHGPIDVMTLMLGTNDVKTRFGATARTVTAGIAGLLDIALGDEMQARHGGFKVLLICPPPVKEVGPIAREFFGGRDVSLGLPVLFSELAAARGAGFLDAGQVIEVSEQDGVHYEADAHAELGKAVAEALATL